MDIHIIGGGILAELIIEIIESNPDMKVAGIYDDGYPNRKNVLGYNIIGKIDHIQSKSQLHLAIGIGEPKFRMQFLADSRFKDSYFPSLIHKTALISKYSKIGKGVIVGPFTSILNNSRIGKGCCILSHVNINQSVVLENFCLVGAGVIIGNGVHIGEGCHLGMGSKISLNYRLKAWSSYD